LKLTESYTAVEVPVRPFGKGTLQTRQKIGKWKSQSDGSEEICYAGLRKCMENCDIVI
jgi:hypothetical protein